VERQAAEHWFETDFGAKNVRSIPLPVARILWTFSARFEDFHRKIWELAKK
jgi:hypothetical protein